MATVYGNMYQDLNQPISIKILKKGHKACQQLQFSYVFSTKQWMLRTTFVTVDWTDYKQTLDEKLLSFFVVVKEIKKQ